MGSVHSNSYLQLPLEHNFTAVCHDVLPFPAGDTLLELAKLAQGLLSRLPARTISDKQGSQSPMARQDTIINYAHLWKTSLCFLTGFPDRKLDTRTLEEQALESFPCSGESMADTCSRLSLSSLNGVSFVNNSGKKNRMKNMNFLMFETPYLCI